MLEVLQQLATIVHPQCINVCSDGYILQNATECESKSQVNEWNWYWTTGTVKTDKMDLERGQIDISSTKRQLRL